MEDNIYHSLKIRLNNTGYWIAFFGMLIPFLSISLWNEYKAGFITTPFGWATVFATPLIYFTGMVWIAPIPWQTKEGCKGGGASWAKALLLAEIYMVAMVIVDATLKELIGKNINIKMVIPLHVVFHAPAMVLVGHVIAARERLGVVNQSLLLQAKEAQTRALQAQLHPHVLFNALNGLAELIHKDADQAEESVRHLSDLLRKVLAATDDPNYRLRDERFILEHYLNMEGLRLGKRLHLGWDWDNTMEDLKLPPLLLQPLVENAIKHGVAPSREGGEMRIQARREGDEAVLCVRNTGMPLDPRRERKGASIGLVNLESRLALAFEGAARFTLTSAKGWTVAEVRLPWMSSLNRDGRHESA